MATLVVVGVLAALAGYAIGRLHKFSAHVEDDFQAWRDRITAAALQPPVPALPPPFLELTAERLS